MVRAVVGCCHLTVGQRKAVLLVQGVVANGDPGVVGVLSAVLVLCFGSGAQPTSPVLPRPYSVLADRTALVQGAGWVLNTYAI